MSHLRLLFLVILTVGISLPLQAEEPQLNLRGSIKLPFMGTTVYPDPVGPFVAVAYNDRRQRSQVVVYDLRTQKPVGAPIGVAISQFTYSHLSVSPDGKWFAGRPKKVAGPIIHVWSTADGKLRPLEIDSDPKYKVTLVKLLPGDRLLTMKHEHEFPDPETGAAYQIWDLKTGKATITFDHKLVFHGKWGAVSRDGNRLAFENTSDGYLITQFDLTTGKQAGEFAFQGKKDTWGQAAGMAYSPDGKQIAMLWRTKLPKGWGRLIVWDAQSGKEIHDHVVKREFDLIDSVWGKGAPGTLQWLPDGNGWLLFGHLWIDQKSGDAIWRVGNEPRLQPDRHIFLDAFHITGQQGQFRDKKIAIETLPQKKIEAARKR